MSRLVITADIHGSLSTWKKIRSLVGPKDSLAVAGDLFDTVYGDHGNADYQPDKIKKEFRRLGNAAHYVYGNCDKEDFFYGYESQLSFEFEGYSILMNHGHLRLPDLTDYQIIIEGHSHVPRLDYLMGKIFLNPGSPTYPRSEYPSYAIIENHRIQILEFTRNTVMSEFDFSNL